MKKYIGTALVTAFLCIFVAVVTKSDDRPRSQSPVVIGRYQLYVPPEHVGLAILLDTATGKTWQQEKYTEVIGEPSAWVPTGEKLDNESEIEIWTDKQIPKPKEK